MGSTASDSGPRTTPTTTLEAYDVRSRASAPLDLLIAAIADAPPDARSGSYVYQQPAK